MAPQELDKVLSITFYAEVTKRNRDTNELESLKIMQCHWTVFKRENSPQLGIVQSRSFTIQTKSIVELHRLHPQIPSPKKTRSLSLNHRTKEDLPSLIQATRIELWYMKETVFVLTSDLLVCLLCLNEFSSHDIVCILNKMSKRFRFRYF